MPRRHHESHCCCCGRSDGCLSPPHQSSQSDHLLLSLAARILSLHSQQPQIQPPSPLVFFPSNFQSSNPSSLLRSKPLRRQESDLSAVVRRIQALETSLSNFNSSSPPPSSSSFSSVLRDTAARVIQIHFRSFLVRRSRTLGQLKRLAHIKSVLETLKSHASDASPVDLDYVSVTTNQLFFQLDSVQGRDLIIVNGKRSIGLELVRFIEHLDTLSVEEGKISTKSVNFLKVSRVSGRIGAQKEKTGDYFSRFGNVGGLECVHRENGHKIKQATSVGNGRKQGSTAKTRIRGTSAEGRAFSIPLCSTTSDFLSSGEEEELLGMTDMEQGSQSRSKGIMSCKNNQRNGNCFNHNELQNSDMDFTFSAPLPMKMESRAGLDHHKMKTASQHIK